MLSFFLFSIVFQQFGDDIDYLCVISNKIFFMTGGYVKENKIDFLQHGYHSM